MSLRGRFVERLARSHAACRPSITRQVSARAFAYRRGNRHARRRPAPWRHDHTTEHIHVAGASNRRSRKSAGKRVGAASRRTRGHVHGRARLLHRQRRAAVDAARPAREQRLDRMGRRRLLADVRGVPDRGRPVGRQVRSPPGVLARPRAVHARLRGMRRRRQPRDAGAGTAGAGHRRGARDAQRPVDHRRDLRRPAARASAWHLRPGDGRGGSQRTADRRRARAGRCARPGMAKLLSDQRPDRPRRARAGASPGAGVARTARKPARRRRDAAAHGGGYRDRAAAGRGSPARLATVDMGVAGKRAGDPAGVRCPPAAGWRDVGESR